MIEKNIKSERYEHQQTKYDLQRRSKENKEFRDRTMMETNMKFGALQQSYKLLKIQNDDLTTECAKNKQTQLEEINGLQRKMKSLNSQNVQMLKEKDKEIEHLKVC